MIKVPPCTDDTLKIVMNGSSGEVNEANSGNDLVSTDNDEKTKKCGVFAFTETWKRRGPSHNTCSLQGARVPKKDVANVARAQFVISLF